MVNPEASSQSSSLKIEEVGLYGTDSAFVLRTTVTDVEKFESHDKAYRKKRWATLAETYKMAGKVAVIVPTLIYGLSKVASCIIDSDISNFHAADFVKGVVAISSSYVIAKSLDTNLNKARILDKQKDKISQSLNNPSMPSDQQSN